MHHDNASPHTSFHTMKHINKWGLQLLPHPPNSPDMAPCDFGFFPKLKSELRGRRFGTIKELQTEVRRILLSWDEEIFNDIMHDMVARWQKCSAAQGCYFEGDNITIDPLFVWGEQETDEETDDSD